MLESPNLVKNNSNTKFFTYGHFDLEYVGVGQIIVRKTENELEKTENELFEEVLTVIREIVK